MPQLTEFLTFIAAVSLLLLCGAAGCNSATGGSSQKHDNEFRFEYRPDGTVVFTDSRIGGSTTQPSGTGFGSNVPWLGGSKDGEIGSLSYATAKETFRNVWPLVLLFMGGAVVCWLIKERLAAMMFAALAILTMLYPLATVLLAIAVIAYAGWSVWKKHKQLILGNEAALAVLPPEQRSKAVVMMETKQDESTKAVVTAVSNTPEAKAAAAEAKNGKDHK